MGKIFDLYLRCRKSGSNFILVIFRFLYVKMFYKKSMLLHPSVTIKGIQNIYAKESIDIGIGYVGFMHRTDKTYLNIKGKLEIAGRYSIGRGCRFDIGENAVVQIGKNGYMNSNSSLIIMHKLVIGDNCAISWDCQFLDEDFHEISYPGKRQTDNSILIGNDVWIGCGARIYKGAVIPDGCVIASDSIVKGVFNTANSLIGGHPAKVIKENIQWK